MEKSLNIKQMSYFIAVAEELHFGRAAERLNVAQPPLSRQIKQIEEELGALLFNRGRNAVTLTQAGERLYVRLQKILADLEDTKLEIKRLGQGAEGRLRIGFVGSSTYGVLPTIIKSFRANFPQVNLSLLPMNNAQLHRALIRREIDIAFARPALNDLEFTTRHLSKEDIVAAVPDTLETASNGVISGEEVAANNTILYPEYPRPSFADFIIDNFERQGIQLTKRVFTMDLQTALSLVAIGEGICIVPASVASTRRVGIKFMKIGLKLEQTALSLNHRLDERGVQVNKFVTIAQQVARKTI
jgi:DNA-binding transcriptional LysR family regulator